MSTAHMIRGVLLACGLLLTAACSAHNDGSPTASAVAASAQAAASPEAPVPAASTTFTEGKEYVALKLPAGQAQPTGPVEVVEAFSYGCPHCAEFAPYMDKLRAQLPKDVTVRYMPVVFSDAWAPYAQAFYAAQQLGVLEQTHDALFKAMLEHYPLNSLQDMATWYGRHGVDPQKFLAAATSDETIRKMTADRNTEMGWGIDSTPTLVVGRRASDAKDAPFVALMRSAEIKSYAQLQQLGLWMTRQVEQR
jgi:thiol:disulfide interchange protein DsbA